MLYWIRASQAKVKNKMLPKISERYSQLSSKFNEEIEKDVERTPFEDQDLLTTTLVAVSNYHKSIGYT